MVATALGLVDKLIDCWSGWETAEDYYLNVLAPAIVRGDNTVELTPREQEIVRSLKADLLSSEWENLPSLIRTRRALKLERLESDRSRLEERRRQEKERRKQESVRRDQNRKRKEERRRQELLQREEERREAEERKRREVEERKRRESLRREQEHRKAEEQRAKKQTLLARIRTVLEHDYLAADGVLRNDTDRNLITSDEYTDLKLRFIQDWAAGTHGLQLDRQQAEAVGTVGKNVLVTARAGSGKTRTLVTRALFLQQHCGVSRDRILLLAFNRDAANEMQERLHSALKGSVPYVMTFHALAYALVHPDEDLLYDEPSAGNLGLSREIQRVIDHHLQSPHYRNLIRDLMLSHFRDDWERIVKGGFNLPVDELVEFRKSLPRETLHGEFVKSYGERLIANTLFEHDIEYKYERNFRWDGVNYKPDFTLFLSNPHVVVIEYFGLKGDSDYDQDSYRKRRFWSQRLGDVLIEVSPTDVAANEPDGFVRLLLEKLEKIGIKWRKLTNEEIWQRIEDRAVYRFTRAMESFVSRCGKENMTPDDLRSRVSRHEPINEAEKLFLEIGESVYSGYLQRSEDSHHIDFNALVWRAIADMKSGVSQFARDKGRIRGDLRNIRYVLIDEFQDFSAMFHALSSELQRLSPNAEFFCVGDDWQAINGFAGSDLTYFRNFPKYFGETVSLNVSTNYRSPTDVVNLGNAVMSGYGTPATAHRSDSGWIRTASLPDFSPTITEGTRYGGDEATPALLRLVKHLLTRDPDIVLLSRSNYVPWYVHYADDRVNELDGLERFEDHIRSFFPSDVSERISVTTTHKYKGREMAAVVVLDADERRYPLVHPNWVFLRLFGDSISSIFEEERRLFYVALTRSKNSLVIVNRGPQQESSFLVDLRRRMTLNEIAWNELSPLAPEEDAMIEIRVSNAFKVKDLLKQDGYHWNRKGRYWGRATGLGTFSFEALRRQPWAQPGITIEAYSEDGQMRKRMTVPAPDRDGR